MQSRSFSKHIYIVAAALTMGACGGGVLDVGHPTSNSGGGGGGGASVGTAASYDGILADSARQGRFNLTVSAAQAVTGTITFPGLTVPITGTVDTVAQQLHATGGGYTITGQPYHGTMQGTYTGTGTSTGYLIASSDSLTALTHSSYCGTYTSTNGNGFMSLIILSDGEVGGFAVQKVGHAVSQSFTGSFANGTTLSATTNLSAPVNGTLSAGVITGTYSPPIGSTAGTGTFSMSFGSC